MRPHRAAYSAACHAQLSHIPREPSGLPVARMPPPVVSVGTARVTLPPGSFLQATAAGEEALAALVFRHCKGAKHIADLFCGVGPFALRLATRARIAAFDSDAGAVTGWLILISRAFSTASTGHC